MLHTKELHNVRESVIMTLSAPADKVWDVISAGDGVDKWFPSLIATCRVEDGKRYCTTTDGAALEEDIIEVNHEAKTFKYGIPSQSMLPVENILGTMKVTVAENGNALVEWSGTFDVASEDEQTAREAFKGLWQMGLNDLENYVQTIA